MGVIGKLSRQIVLGDTLDVDNVSATFADGVLVVSVPVSAQAQTRRIEINHAPLRTEREVTATATEAPTA